VLVTHEGGYSPVYVPFCGLAVVEELADERTEVVDPYAEQIDRRPHQRELSLDQAEALGQELSALQARDLLR
jgi:hypothetical protein